MKLKQWTVRENQTEPSNTRGRGGAGLIKMTLPPESSYGHVLGVNVCQYIINAVGLLIGVRYRIPREHLFIEKFEHNRGYMGTDLGCSVNCMRVEAVIYNYTVLTEMTQSRQIAVVHRRWTNKTNWLKIFMGSHSCRGAPSMQCSSSLPNFSDNKLAMKNSVVISLSHPFSSAIRFIDPSAADATRLSDQDTFKLHSVALYGSSSQTFVLWRHVNCRVDKSS